MSPKATDEGGSRERQRLTSLEHPSSVSALRADPPSPTGGEGKSAFHLTIPALACSCPDRYSEIEHSDGKRAKFLRLLLQCTGWATTSCARLR
ncbi:MAG: hypothetical protein EOQ96_02330 [Mesorhizobium sp.]|nr:MAG: hypothetical protein EOQ96_02330 [Mesorhizobium sp.]